MGRQLTIKLPTMAEVAAGRPRVFAQPKKPAPLAKLDRAKAKVKATSDDTKKVIAWGQAVKRRDKWLDRYTGDKVRPLSEVAVTHPRSAHAHHIEPRENRDTRYDRRNGVTVSFETHCRLEANELKVVGTKFYQLKGKRYLNGDDKNTKIVEAK